MADRGYTVKLGGVPTGRRGYRCDEHGAFEVVVELATSATPRPCPTCGAPCERTLEAALFKPQRGVVRRGKSEEPPPLAMDTTPLADGMDEGEWRARFDAKVHAADMDELKRAGAF